MDPSALYRDIVETSPDGIWVIDLQGRTIYANAQVARMYGVPYDEIGSLTVHDTLDEVGRVQFDEHLLEVLSGTPNESEVEVYFLDKSGAGTWITLRESLLHDEEGNLMGLLHRISDYEARRRVLDELTRSRRQLQEAQEIAKLGSWVYDIASARVTVLGGDDRIATFAAAVPSLASFGDFAEMVHPHDRESTLEATRRLLGGPDQFSFDTRLRWQDSWVSLRVRGVLHRNADGTVHTIAGTHQDVTEIAATERALRDEVERTAILRAISAAANAARTFTEVVEETLPSLLAQGFWLRASIFVVEDGALVPLLDHPGTDDRIVAEAAFRTRDLQWGADGTTAAVPICAGDRIYAIGTITSTRPPVRRELVETMVHSVGVQLGRVAEREEASRSLAAARDEAMSASLQKSQFLATMSHEIRTPLNGVIGLNDLLLRTELSAEQQRLASGVRVAGRSLLAVISDVLDFSKIDGRPLELEHVDVEVRSMLDQVIRVLSAGATAGGVELLASCHHDVPASVLGDPTRLSQVLLNLVSNAVKFSRGGDVLVRATVEELRPDDVVLRFEVRDSGIGIDPEHVPRLFEPFTQADASTTRQYGGTGLGLAIARELVAALGGTLEYTPNPGGGSVFTFTAVCGRMPAPSAALDDYARTWLSGRRVLLADANAARGDALVEQLTWWHLRATRIAGAADVLGELARSLAEEDPVNGVLIDLGATNDALGLVSAIAADSAYDEIPMLALGSVSKPDLDVLRETGVSVVLGRPLPGELLRGTLLEQLAGVPAQPAGSRSPTPSAAPGRTRVLVVEDNPVNQLVATGMLESMGYAVEISPDGAHALDLLAHTTFDAILMDVQMPVLDGYATTRTLREREAGVRHVPVIAMTAAAVEGERERCLDSGMDDFLTKPVDPTTLAAALSRWLPLTERTHDMTSYDETAPRHGSPGPDAPAPLPPTPPIDGLDTERLDMLRDLDPGDTTYLDRAIGNFQVNSVAAVHAIRALVEAADAPGLKATAHKIAGSALNLGVPRAGESARALEVLADTGSTEGAAALLPELVESMTLGCELLLRYQRTYSS